VTSTPVSAVVAKAIKRDKYTCQCCGGKQSRAKGKEFYVEVHHEDGIFNWDALCKAVYEHLLCPAEKLTTLCKECHSKEEITPTSIKEKSPKGREPTMKE